MDEPEIRRQCYVDNVANGFSLRMYEEYLNSIRIRGRKKELMEELEEEEKGRNIKEHKDGEVEEHKERGWEVKEEEPENAKEVMGTFFQMTSM